MDMKRMTILLVLPLAFSLIGCSTWIRLTEYPASPQIYGGVRATLGGVTGHGSPLLVRNWRREWVAPILSRYLVFDLPFSLALDTAFLPMTLSAPGHRWQRGRDAARDKVAWDKEMEEKIQFCNRVGPGVVMKKADLGWCDLRSKDMRGADLSGANLAGAHLEGANLADASLDGANLENAVLEGANLAGATLRNASLRGAKLKGAALAGVNLAKADLQGADLFAADLGGADLRGATGVNLEDTLGTPAHLPGDPLDE